MATNVVRDNVRGTYTLGKRIGKKKKRKKKGVKSPESLQLTVVGNLTFVFFIWV